MRCRQVRSKLTLLVDGRLSSRQEDVLYRHLQSCPDCGRQLRQLEKQVRLLGEPARFSPPADLWPRLATGLAGEQSPVARRPRILTCRPAALAAAAVVLVALFAWLYWPHSSVQVPQFDGRRVVASAEVEELDLFLSAHKSLELENPLSAELGIIALVTDNNNGGMGIY